MSKIKLQGDIIGLDIGAARTGVARINSVARIAEPLTVIDMKSDGFVEKVNSVISENDACAVVVGVPRGLDGQVTEQTRWTVDLLKTLENGLKVPVYSIDEAGTTKKAELISHPGQSIDSVAAGIILEDFTVEVLAGRIDNVSF